jgi:hypothetical protein
MASKEYFFDKNQTKLFERNLENRKVLSSQIEVIFPSHL